MLSDVAVQARHVLGKDAQSMQRQSPTFLRRAMRVTTVLAWCLLPFQALAYERITDSEEVVLNKLFTKKGKIEADGRFGLVLNTSYTQTFLLSGGLSYFWSEEWGFSGEANLALNSDKSERNCIENFYNKFKNKVEGLGECPAAGEPSPFNSPTTDPDNYGPAYVPIRELKYILTGNAIWNPIYGKQIILLSATNYFDFFVKFGGGIAMSDFYSLRTTLKDNDKIPSRSTAKNPYIDGAPADKNPGTLDSNNIGKAGRPDPLGETSPLLHLAVGERFHFLKRFVITGTLDNYTLFGNGLENFFTISGGIGARF